MKKALRCSGIFVALLVEISILLLQFGHALTMTNKTSGASNKYFGQDILFVYSTASAYSGVSRHEPSRTAIFVFIFMSLLAFAFFVSFILSLKDNKSSNAWSGLIILLSALGLLVCSICVFFIPYSWKYANNDNFITTLGGDYVAASILAIAGFIISIPVAIINFKSAMPE